MMDSATTTKKARKMDSIPNGEKQASSPKSIGRIVMNAVRKLQGRNGTTLPEIKKYLRTNKNLDMGMVSTELKMFMKNAIERGLLTREGGQYKVGERARRRRRSSPRASRRRRSGSRRRSRSRSAGRKRSKRSSGRRKRSSGRRRSRRRRTAPV